MINNDTSSLSLSLLFKPEYTANPYPIYHHLRSTQPVYWDEGIENWVLTRYDDIIAAVHDRRLTAERVALDVNWFPEALRPLLEPAIQALTKQMIFLDPPHHTRLRSLVAKAFTPRMIEKMRSHIQYCIDQLLDTAQYPYAFRNAASVPFSSECKEIQAHGCFDIIRDFAYPLPGIVIVDMLGIRPEDRQKFVHWTDDYGALLDGKVRTRKQLAHVLYSVGNLLEYFRTLLAERQTAPKDDLLQALITAQEQGDVLSEEELLANCVLLLVTGHGTTTHLIGNGLLALLQHPDQLQDIRNDFNLMNAAVTEILRYESPVPSAVRRAKEDFELGGQHIQAGQGVFLCLGAANRDPSHFPDPDQFNIYRAEGRHLAFGHGIHVCLGASLARIQGHLALQTLLQRFPTLQLETETLTWEPGLSIRGLKELPVRFY